MLNEILGVGARFQQALTRKFGILGGAPSPQLTPEITPEYQLPTGDEDRILIGEYLCSGGMGVTAAAGQLGAIQLSNPDGSNIVLDVYRLSVIHVDGGELIGGICWFAPLPTAPGPGAVVIDDMRVSRVGDYTRLPTAKLRSSTSTPPLSVEQNQFRCNLAANGLYEVLPKVILPPGASFQVTAVAAAKTYRAYFHWREIPIALGEQGPF